MSNEQARGWRVRPKSGGPWIVIEKLSDAEADMMTMADEHGEVEFIIERRDLPTEEQFEKMKEFDGW